MTLLAALLIAVAPVDGQTIQTDTVLDPGTYSLPSGITVAGAGVHLTMTGVTLQGSGSGAGLTVTASGATITGGLVTGYATGLDLLDAAGNTFAGTRFDGNGRGGHTTGWGTGNNTFDHASFSGNTGDGIDMDYSTGSQNFTATSFDDNGGSGLFASYNAHKIDGCSFSRNGGNGFFSQGWSSVGTVIANSVLDDNAGCGGSQWSAPGVRYQSNTASGNKGAAFCIYGGSNGGDSNGAFVGNTADHNGGGINASFYISHVLVQDNSIHDNAGPGVGMGSGPAIGWQIEGNEIYANAGDGIELADDYATIDTNRVHDNCGYGLNAWGPMANVVLQGNDFVGNGACVGGKELSSAQPFDAGASGSGNWWGHAPLLPGVDTSGAEVTDSRAMGHSAFDFTPPVTVASVAGAAGANGWFVSAVSVTLAATDAESGVASTAVRIDGGAAQPYQGPIALGDGAHSLVFSSTDNAGNVEAPQTLAVKVDTQPPALSASTQVESIWPPDGRMVDVGLAASATDALSAAAVNVSVASSEAPERGIL